MESEPTGMSRRKKKMKKKRMKEQFAMKDIHQSNSHISVDDETFGEKKKSRSKLEKMSQELGLDKFSDKDISDKIEHDEQLVGNTMSIRGHERDVVVFPKRVRKSKMVADESEDKPLAVVHSPKALVFNIKKARYEVLKFGISGFEKVDKEEAKIAYAVSLGAKPPKKKYLNYKELMEKKKREKIEMEQLKRGHQMLRKIGSRKQSKPHRRKVRSKAKTTSPVTVGPRR